MPLSRRGSAKVKHAARLAFLSAHRDLFDGVPGIHEDVTDAGRQRLDALREVMDGHGLFGHSTIEIQRETIRRLVSELRGEHVGGGW